LSMKRILSLDGGGIRGVFSLQILARIEKLLRDERNNQKLVLADEFHLIAGTSTGAIIAAFLAWGAPVSKVQELYDQRSDKMFALEPWYRRWKCKYRADAIAELFRKEFSEVQKDGTMGPATLGSKNLKTLLLVILRNASTGSPWPVCSNPDAMFCDLKLPDCNLHIPLWQLLRGSTAAPSYFPPEEIDLADKKHLFIDGGMTPFNNPALIAFLMATLPQYRINWPASREDLHVTSIGTGFARARLPLKRAAQINMLDQIKYLAPAFIGSVSVEQDVLCRIFGDCLHGASIDLELGALEAPTLLSRAEQKFTYVRYDEPFDIKKMEPASKLSMELDNLKLMPYLKKAGEEYAASHVRLEDLYPRK
jgi:hypothetical protein